VRKVKNISTMEGSKLIGEAKKNFSSFKMTELSKNSLNNCYCFIFLKRKRKIKTITFAKGYLKL